MDKTLEDKIKYCATLLAKSLLAEEYKEIILGLIAEMTENDLDTIIASLEKENEELEKLSNALKEIDAEQDALFEKIKKEQEEKARELGDKFLADILREQIKNQ